MKLYRCNKHDADLGAMLSWHSNKRDADADLRQHKKDRSGERDGPEGVEAVEIPTDKTGLLAWLNKNFHSDNG